MFDTANMVDGCVYQLEAHLTRLMRSAQLTGLEPPFTLQQMYRTVLETAAASCKANGVCSRQQPVLGCCSLLHLSASGGHNM